MSRPRKKPKAPVVDRVVVYQQDGRWSFVAYAGDRYEIAEDWFKAKPFVLRLVKQMFPDAVVEQASLIWDPPLPPAVDKPAANTNPRVVDEETGEVGIVRDSVLLPRELPDGNDNA